MRRRLPVCVAAALVASSCATASRTPVDIAGEIRSKTGATARLDPEPTSRPPAGVQLDDGLSRDEAVAIALWNNAAFHVNVSQLGFARADVAEAGIIANPVLSLLFPWGPKQFEATLRWPVEVLWERPRRVAAATLSFEAAAQGLVQAGLELAFSVRVAHADLALAVDRRSLAAEAAAALDRIDAMTQSRLAAGDIGTLEARAARVDAARAAQDAERAAHDLSIARERLRLLLGLPPEDGALDVLQASADVAGCGSADQLLRQALAARPDLRAAEIGVEAAAARLGWEQSRILTLTAVLDANGAGTQGFEAGPGLDVSLPVFNRNQGGRLRAASELQRASATYVALQQQTGLDVRESLTLLDQARQSQSAWRDRLVAPLQQNLSDAEESYASGETSYLFVLENSRRLIEARVRERELAADGQRARARVERAAGISCVASLGATP